MLLFLALSKNSSRIKYSFDSNQSILIGRGLECDIIIPDTEEYKFISRTHCTILLDCENEIFIYYLYDGNIIKPSLNKTWVDGSQIQTRHKLKNRDIITFGESKEYPCLMFLFEEEQVINGDTNLIVRDVKQE